MQAPNSNDVDVIDDVNCATHTINSESNHINTSNNALHSIMGACESTRITSHHNSGDIIVQTQTRSGINAVVNPPNTPKIGMFVYCVDFD